jgi:CBS domain containing-hemolysin-like protein
MIFFVIFLTILASAFFSGYEIAFISANKLKIELGKAQQQLSARILSKFVKQPSHFIGTILVGNNIALVIYSIMMSRLIDHHIAAITQQEEKSTLVLIISTIISTHIILVFGEFIPKALFRLNPNSLLNFFAIPFQAFYWILSPIAIGFAYLSKLILKVIFGLKIEEKKPVFERADLEHFIRQTQPQETHHQDINTDLFENALYLTQVKVRECMIPRTEMVMIEVTDTMEQLRSKFIQTKLSKLIVYEEEVDNVLGYVHHQDLLKKPSSIKAIIKQVPAIPESMPAVDLMNLFMRERKSIAWVVDEHGGTSGLVTMEDVLEEIFGDIQDEYDATEGLLDKQLAEREFLFSGRLEIDYINDKYNLHIPHGEYETLSGYILANHESIPTENEELNIDNYDISIIAVSETKIETVKLKVIPKL